MVIEWLLVACWGMWISRGETVVTVNVNEPLMHFTKEMLLPTVKCFVFKLFFYFVGKAQFAFRTKKTKNRKSVIQQYLKKMFVLIAVGKRWRSLRDTYFGKNFFFGKCK